MSTAVTPRGTLSAAQAARRAALPQAAAERRPMGDLAINRMLLRGRTISADLRGAIIDATLERTIDTASTLTLTAQDRERKLYRSGVLHRGAELEVNGLGFVLARIEKDEDRFNLTFEDREVWALRQHDRPRKVTRTARMTRARFIESLIREVKHPRIGLWAPERDVVQPIAPAAGGGIPEPYEFSRGTVAEGGDRGEKEDSWTAIRRLADEVQWRAYMVAGVLHLATDRTILRLASRFPISERTRGIDSIRWTLDEGLRVQEASVACRAPRWGAPPGTVVSVTGEGPADGLWIVSGMRRSLWSVQAEVTLTRPRAALPEPAPSMQASDAISGPLAAGSAGGFTANANVTVKGVRADAVQLRTIHECLAEAARQGASRRVMVAIVMCITQESVARPLNRGDAAGPDSRGPFQQRATWGTLAERMNPTSATRLFLRAWRQAHGSVTNAPGNLSLAINKVQRSAHPMAYARWQAEAERTVAAWLAGATPASTSLPRVGPAGVPTVVMRALERAEAIHRKRQMYQWAGGHGNIRSEGPFDCSGMVSNVLGPLGAGILGGTMTTLGFQGWGQAGRGRWMTVWVSRTHMHIQFTLPGFTMIYEAQKPGTVTGRRPGKTPGGGLAPRHYPGT